VFGHWEILFPKVFEFYLKDFETREYFEDQNENLCCASFESLEFKLSKRHISNLFYDAGRIWRILFRFASF